MNIDVPALLDELCITLGLCLDPESRARLSIAPPADIDEFERAILLAEGLDPITTDRRVRHALRECIERYQTHG